MDFEREIVKESMVLLKKRLPMFLMWIGPRQVGKTMAAQQIIKRMKWPSHYATADSPLPPGPEWIENQWYIARTIAVKSKDPVLLILDEIQKVHGWAEIIKKLWDQEKHEGKIKLIVLGSSALLLQKGLSESLTGRFILQRFTHWSFKECHTLFGWSLDKWLYFGGYPGAALLVDDESLWKRHIADALIETTIARDVLEMQAITKPVLLRHLFAISAAYPAQIFSYNKMLGQLQDAGNTATLAHYLQLLEGAFLVSGLELFSKGQIRKRGSSPKLILWNNALINALSLRSFKDVITDYTWRGRLIENAVGAHLLNSLASVDWSITYWRDGPYEVDFVLRHGSDIFAIEVKSGRSGRRLGLERFQKEFSKAKGLLIGEGGMALESFFKTSPLEWIKSL